MPDHLNACTICPDLKLFDRRSTKSVRRTEKHLPAARLEVRRQLPDRGSLAHSIDPDHQNHRRLG